MNPPRAPGPSRFPRGRSRGGYRPYFFFKRNGQTIPAHGRNTGRAGGNSRGGRGAARQSTNTSQVGPITNSFLRPQFHVAPEDAQQQIASMAIEAPMACPGWRLYFYKEPFNETGEIYNRIKIMESYISRNLANFDLLDIQSKGHFIINATPMQQDEPLQQQWPKLMDDFLYSPMRTLAIIAIAMHSLTTTAAVEASSSQDACNKNHYFPKVIKPRKIYARPVGFMPEKPIRLIGNFEVDQLYSVRGFVSAIGSVDAAASWIAYRCTKCRQEQALKQKGTAFVNIANV